MPAIFVIGAGPQIASAVANLFVKNGNFSVGLASRSSSNLEKYKALLPEGTKVATAEADAGDPASCVRALEILKSALGTPSAVLYNAASLSLGLKPLSDLTIEEMDGHMKMNVVAGFAVLQWGAKNITNDEEGRAAILITGGGLAFHPYKGLSGLGAGKAGLLNLAKSFQLEFPHIHFATVIVKGYVDRGDPYYTSTLIAEDYWKLCVQKEGEWVPELEH